MFGQGGGILISQFLSLRGCGPRRSRDLINMQKLRIQGGQYPAISPEQA